MKRPRFLAFLAGQFLGAANDNAYKVTLVLLILATVPDERTQILYASLAAAFFPIPFLLFSPLAGSFADRWPKHRVLFWTKAPEVAAMALATLGFWLSSLPLLLAALFFMATQAAFFSPAKYGLLPEIVSSGELSMANGILELATNLAILAGSIAGVLVYGVFKEALVGAGIVYFAVAVAGTVFVAFVPRGAEGRRDLPIQWNLLSTAVADWREVGKSRVLFYTLLGIAWFSFLGSFFLTLIPVYGKNVLGLAEESSGMLLAILSVGIGAGSIIAGKLSRNHVEIGLVPLGAIGISAVSLHLGLGSGGGRVLPFGVPLRTAIDLVALGLFSGFFIVPLNALLQSRAPDGMRGRLIAFSNVLSFTAVLFSAAVPSILAAFGLGTGGMIQFVAALTVVGTVYVVNLVPDFLVRLVFWLLTNTVYRIHPVGTENIPKGGVLFVANHVSWVDFLMVGGACDRMIRFLMFRAYYELSPLHWFFRRMGVIPVAAGDPPEKTEESLAIARRELDAGNAVCIFAEGAITRTGNLLKFKRGFERIAAGANAPIVPVYLEGVWGSLFSFERGRFFLKRPKRFRAHVTVVFGEALPPTARADEVRSEVQELAAVAFAERKSRQRTLPALFLAAARRHWGRAFLSDERRTVTFGEALVRALAIRDRLFPGAKAPASKEELVGLAFAPGIDGALANLAVALAGRVPVNLDTTDGGKWARISAARAGVRRVLTSHELAAGIRGGEVTNGFETMAIDEALESAAHAKMPLRALVCRLAPLAFAARVVLVADSRTVDELATVFFWWPPDAPERPLGAALTHHNLTTNLQSLRQVFEVEYDDVVLGVAPFSNPIGFVATLWLPAISGASVVFAGDAIAPGDLGRRIGSAKVTIVPIAPAVVEQITAHAERKDLATVRFVATGGGDLTDEARRAFETKFAIDVLEGYGRPEAGAIVSLNVPRIARADHRQPSARAGSTGHPLPGVAIRIVDPATGTPVSPGHEGILHVRGPNVTRGYVRDENATRLAFVDGWFVTGDRASVDQDGFLTVYPS